MSNIIKIVIIAAVCILVVGAVVGYFIWQTNEARNELYATQTSLNETAEELNTTKNNLATMQEELNVANMTIEDLKGEEYRLVYLGNYQITHYCTEKYKHICGTGNGITATGTEVTAGRTVAVDPTVIPYGTTMYIEGYGFRVAEDCGGAVKGNHIDMAVDTHANALAMGSPNRGVWILVKK